MNSQEDLAKLIATKISRFWNGRKESSQLFYGILQANLSQVRLYEDWDLQVLSIITHFVKLAHLSHHN